MPKLFICILLLCASHVAVAGTVNYCLDEQSNQDWNRLTVEYSEIIELKTLHNLRKALCDQVKTGDIELSDAIDLFEVERIKVLKQLRQRFERTVVVDITSTG